MKFAIFFALFAMACASSHDLAVPVFYNAASSPGFISGRNVYSGNNLVIPGNNLVIPGNNFVYPGSGIVPTTYSAVAPGNFAFRSAAFPSAVSYQSAPVAAITYNAPIATYSAPITPYKAPAVAYSAIAPKTIAQTAGSSHITY